MPAFQLDNDGTAAWRQNQAPKEEFPIPRDVYIKDSFSKITRIAKDTGTYVEYVRGTRVYHIWGDIGQVANAKSLLENMIADADSNPQDGNKPRKWAKIPSRTAEARRLHEQEMDVEDMKQRYRRNPPVEAVFESIVCIYATHNQQP